MTLQNTLNDCRSACCHPPPPHSLPSGQELYQQSGGNFEGLRAYLRQLAVAAYQQKAAAVDDIEPGLMQEAQKFFVLTQTDNLWKEHLQVGVDGPACGGREEGRLRGGGMARTVLAHIRVSKARRLPPPHTVTRLTSGID